MNQSDIQNIVLPDRTYFTMDHPECGGRVRQIGERSYYVNFPIEGGYSLTVQMGLEGAQSLKKILNGLDL